MAKANLASQFDIWIIKTNFKIVSPHPNNPKRQVKIDNVASRSLPVRLSIGLGGIRITDVSQPVPAYGFHLFLRSMIFRRHGRVAGAIRMIRHALRLQMMRIHS